MINNFFSIIRLKNVAISIICIFITLLKFNESIFQIKSIIIFSIILLLFMSSNIINDIFDMNTDGVNRPKRVLVQYPYLLNFFLNIAASMMVLAFILSFFLNIYSVLIILISCPFLILYSKIFKNVPIIGNMLVSFFLALIFIFVAMASENSIINILPEAFIVFTISLIREIVKDVEDYPGDKKYNINTTAVFFGVRKTIFISCFLILVFCIQCAYFINYDLLKYYTLSLILLIFLPLFYLLYFLINKPSISSCSEGAGLLKKVIVLGLLIIYIM